MRLPLRTKLALALWLVCLALAAPPGIARARPAKGQAAPTFTARDIAGKVQDLARMRDRPMVILYFFDVESRPSQEGLLSLNETAKKFRGADLAVWAITLSPKEKVEGFAKTAGLTFPLLLDTGAVSDLYDARIVLPSVYVLGPGLAVLDRFQGGGKTTDTMLVRVAERELQQKSTRVAKALSSQVLKKDPKNPRAKAVQGHAALRERNLKEAQEVFGDLARQQGEGEILGKEGLAAVYAQKGEPDKALALASDVARMAPERAYPRVIQGDVLYSQNRKEEAEASYREAVKAKDAEPYLDAVRYNQLGRLHASRGDYRKAQELYDQAVQVDPYYIEGTTNKGIAFEKEGRWDLALDAYRQALAVDRTDPYAAVLARKAEEMAKLQSDAGRKKRMDQLVKDLAARFKSQTAEGARAGDTWTSGPMILTFLDFQEKGGLAERDGFSQVFLSQLADQLNASGRVRVVDRALLERLLEELNLGTSELADPATALRLGRILAARLIGTGTLLHTGQASLLSLRLIDTETSSIPQISTETIDSPATIERQIFQLNREILRTVITKYPLRGFVAKFDGQNAILNIGSGQGVVLGTKFDVLEEGESFEFKGKTLRAAPKAVGRLEVVQVEPDFCHARVLSGDKALRVEDKVQERAEDAPK